MSRIQLTTELKKDTEIIVLKAVRLVQTCVDVLSSSAWLKQAIAAMELFQMLTQAIYFKEFYMKQLPLCSPALLERFQGKGLDLNYLK